MDGIGFIANLHATTLDSQESNLILKPVRKQNRSVSSRSSGSLSGRAKDLVNRSRSFFSNSSTSSASTRTSISSLSHSLGDDGCRMGHRKSPSTSDSRSLCTPSTSRLPSEDRPRSTNHSAMPSSPSNNTRTKRSHHDRLNAAHLAQRCQYNSEMRAEIDLDPTWISTLVDNGYISPPQSLPPTPPRLYEDLDADSDIEPSRASSMLDREIVFDSQDNARPCLPPPTITQLLSLSIAEQLAISLDEDAHMPWLADCRNLLKPELTPGFCLVKQPRISRNVRPHTAKT